MRVLQVVHQFLPKYVGGTELYAANLSLGLRDRGHDVTIFAGDDTAATRTWQELPIQTVVGGLRGPRGVVNTFLTVFGNRTVEDAFAKALDAYRPDVVHFHHLAGLSTALPALAASRGIASVFTLHDYWFTCANAQLLTEDGDLCGGPKAGINCGRCAALRVGLPSLALMAPVIAPAFVLRGRRIRSALDSVSLVLAPSDFIAGIARRSGVSPERMRRVSFGVRTDEVELPAGNDQSGYEGPVRFTYLGSLARQKGVHVMIDAMRRAPGLPAQLTIYGDPTAYPAYAAELVDLAKDDPRIVFAGPLPRARLAEALANTDALVVPSVWYENSPLVVKEAHAAGVPVLASDVGALTEMVRHGQDGLLFKRDDPEALAETLRTVAQDPAILTFLRASIRPAKSQDEHVGEIEALYREVVAGARSGR